MQYPSGRTVDEPFVRNIVTCLSFATGTAPDRGVRDTRHAAGGKNTHPCETAKAAEDS
jgi:hypothetical protein